MGSGNTKSRTKTDDVANRGDQTTRNVKAHSSSWQPERNVDHVDVSKRNGELPRSVEQSNKKPNSDEEILSDEECFRKYSEENPQYVQYFTSAYQAIAVLKSKVDDQGEFVIRNVLYSEAEFISKLYSLNKTLKCRRALGNLLVGIGFPRTIVHICGIINSVYPEYLTWDRETAESEGILAEEKRQEELETSVVSENNKEKEDDKLKDEKKAYTSNETTADPEVLKKAQNLVSILVLSTINHSDLDDDFCNGCGLAGMVQVFIGIVHQIRGCTKEMEKYVNPETQGLRKYTIRGKILSRILSTLHNLSKRVPCREYFQACNAVQVLIPLLKDKVTLFAFKGLLILVYLIDEENNNLIMADEEPIKLLIHIIGKAVKMTRRRYLGLSTSELAEGLTQIATNDTNKKLIGANGAIPILVDMITTAKNNSDRKCGAEALWILAFDDENREILTRHPTAVKTLKTLRESDNENVKKAASGALWEIEGKQNHTAATTQIAVVGDGETANQETTNHIMISYQWDVQSILIQAKNKLQAAGFKVWMDLEQMGGSTLEAMARAVENSAVVLVCVSQKYKESSNCRSEAEYAFQLRKDIIPLMMEKNYRPDGWLGMIMGSKLWIDFSSRHKVDDSVEKLQKEIGIRGKSGEHIVKAVVEDVVDAAPKVDISNWTKDDVKTWIEEVGLSLNFKAKEKLNGRVIIRLAQLRNESPEFFYNSIKNDLGLSDVFEVLVFTDELEKLVN